MKISNMRELASFVRSRRKHLGWSQAALAEKIGVGRFWVIDLEKGKPTAEVGVVLRALKALNLAVHIHNAAEPGMHQGIDLGEILGGDNDHQ